MMDQKNRKLINLILVMIFVVGLGLGEDKAKDKLPESCKGDGVAAWNETTGNRLCKNSVPLEIFALKARLKRLKQRLVALERESASWHSRRLWPREPGAIKFAVFDSQGQRLGLIDGIVPFPQVIFEVDDVFFPVFALRARLRGTNQGLFFESDDCSGEPLLQVVRNMSPLPNVVVIGNDAFIEDTGASPFTAMSRSIFDSDSDTCTAQTVISDFSPVMKFSELFAPFTPPFTVRRLQ